MGEKLRFSKPINGEKLRFSKPGSYQISENLVKIESFRKFRFPKSW
jgi:hypothetical protein